MASEHELTHTDPESEACFAELSACVLQELQARIAVGDDPHTPAGQQVLADLVADAVLDLFVLRPRTAPRYRRTS